jgi:hypothetical protein
MVLLEDLRDLGGTSRCRTEQVLRARDRSLDRDFTAARSNAPIARIPGNYGQIVNVQ